MKILSSWRYLLVIAFSLLLWFWPAPDAVTQQAWQVFAIFIATIFAVVINAMPILTASIFAMSATILTGSMSADDVYDGFGSGFILLVVAAFLVGRGIINSGLGARIGYTMIRMFGKSSLGLGYSMIATDAIIAAGFPSNTARSGVLFPIVQSLALSSGSKPDEGSRRKIGAYLMINSMAGISLSSTLWFTAMAANPTGAAIAKDVAGIDITFTSWLLASSLPCAVAFAIIPWLLYKVFPPDMQATPEAPKAASAKLQEMGRLSRPELITAVTFLGMILCWVEAGSWGLDKTAVAFLGLAVLMIGKVFTLEDMKTSGDALSTLIWFSVLYTLSSTLNELGFMTFVGGQLATLVAGYSWQTVYLVLVVLYVLIHYLFVSQTAQMLALFGVFVGLATKDQVDPALIAFMLLFATNFFSCITPQGSSANVIFVSSGYLTQGELYKYGGIVTLANLLIFLIIGTPWILMVT